MRLHRQDKTGKFLVPPEYDGALDFREGKALVWKLARQGLKDAAGNVLLEANYRIWSVLSASMHELFLGGGYGWLSKR